MLPPPLRILKGILDGVLSRPRIIIATLIIITCVIIYLFRDPIIDDSGKLKGYKFSVFLTIIVGILAVSSLIVLGLSNIYTKCHLEDNLCEIASEKCGNEEDDEGEDDDE